MRKKIFITDYDGTLFQYGTVSQRDIETIRKFRKEGGLFGIATGRMIASIKHEVERYNIPVDFVIGVNGAITVNQRFEEISCVNIENQVGLQVKDMLKNGKAQRYSITDGYNVFSRGDTSGEFNNFAVEKDIILNNNIKGLFARVDSRETAIALSDKINVHYGMHVRALPNYNYIDIASCHTDKAIAIDKYLRAFDNPLVATSGDAHNDLMMLKQYNGYAMRHGDEDIISQIDYHVDTVSEAILDFMSF